MLDANRSLEREIQRAELGRAIIDARTRVPAHAARTQELLVESVALDFCRRELVKVRHETLSERRSHAARARIRRRTAGEVLGDVDGDRGGSEHALVAQAQLAETSRGSAHERCAEGAGRRRQSLDRGVPRRTEETGLEHPVGGSGESGVIE